MDAGATPGEDDAPPDAEAQGAADPAPAPEVADVGDPPVEPGAPAEPPTAASHPPADGASRALPYLDDAGRSPDPSVCPFLRRDFGGTLVAPASVPGMEQTCVAIGAPRLQSLRQQELVCLRAAHADCPRYLRGAEAAAPARGLRALPRVPRATLAALLILVLSAAISFGYVAQRGGIAMPVVGATATSAAVLSTPSPAPTEQSVAITLEPAPSVSPVVTSEPTLLPSPTPSATAAVKPSPTPVVTPTPTPSPTPKATRKPTATPKSDRYALVRPCPDRRKCFIYTVRSGDNIFSIARYFGIAIATIYDWNPKYARGGRLRAGDQIRMPPPTR